MDSILIQKQVRDNSQELQNFLLDLKNWEQDMKRKEQQLNDNSTESTAIPPVRSKIRKTSKSKTVEKETEEKRRISSYDYSAWDKFDVEKACEEIDTREEEEEEKDGTGEDAEKQRDKALYEKELGNQHVKSQKWKEAIDCYTRAIEHYPYDAIFYANRALCFLKTSKSRAAEADCTTAIQLDETYVKAYQRRALARIANGQTEEAKEDFNAVLRLDPNNTAAQSELAKLTRGAVSRASSSSSSRSSTGSTSRAQSTSRGSSAESILRAPSAQSTSREPSSESTSRQSSAQSTSREPSARSILRAPSGRPVQPSTPSPSSQATARWAQGDCAGEPVLPIQKPPHLRSKKPLRTVVIEDVEDEEELLLKVQHSSSKPNTEKEPEAKTESKLEEEDKRTSNKQNTLQVVDSPSKQLGDSDVSVPVDASTEKQQPAKEGTSANVTPHSTRPEKLLEKAQPASLPPQSLAEGSKKTGSPQPSKPSPSEPVKRAAGVPAAPRTSVQFLVSWKLVRTDADLRYQYLKQLSGEDLPQIFQNSLESKEFSEIITALKTDFVPRNEPVYSLLLGFTKVKRFSALVMFLSKAEKTDIRTLIAYCKSSKQCSEEESAQLFKKYEIKV